MARRIIHTALLLVLLVAPLQALVCATCAPESCPLAPKLAVSASNGVSVDGEHEGMSGHCERMAPATTVRAACHGGGDSCCSVRKDVAPSAVGAQAPRAETLPDGQAEAPSFVVTTPAPTLDQGRTADSERPPNRAGASLFTLHRALLL